MIFLHYKQLDSFYLYMTLYDICKGLCNVTIIFVFGIFKWIGLGLHGCHHVDMYNSNKESYKIVAHFWINISKVEMYDCFVICITFINSKCNTFFVLLWSCFYFNNFFFVKIYPMFFFQWITIHIVGIVIFVYIIWLLCTSKRKHYFFSCMQNIINLSKPILDMGLHCFRLFTISIEQDVNADFHLYSVPFLSFFFFISYKQIDFYEQENKCHCYFISFNDCVRLVLVQYKYVVYSFRVYSLLFIFFFCIFLLITINLELYVFVT